MKSLKMTPAPPSSIPTANSLRGGFPPMSKHVILLFVIPALLSAVEPTLFVAPGGDDSAPGTRDKPLATLAGARDALRRTRTVGENATVSIRGGFYEVGETMVFGPQDSGVTYAAYKGEKPVFAASREITGWKKESGQIWVADAPPGRFYALFDAKGMLPRARGAGFSPLKLPPELVKPIYPAGAGADKSVIYFPSGAIRNWSNLDDVELVIRPRVGWVMNILPLASVDETAGVARTAIPATYEMMPYGRQSAWIENVREALDQPGEWVLDSHAKKIHLWPRTAEPKDIRAPGLREMIRVEGDEAAGNFVHDIVFRGLTFQHGDRDVWTKDDAGLQHDWEMFDKPNALLRFRGAEGCTVEHCEFTESAGTGLRLDLHAQRNRILSNNFSHLGGTGVLLSGYGAGTRDVNRHNEVVNNEIHHMGEIYWHSPGILVSQSGGNHIANNLIHHLPYSGIVVCGPRPTHFSVSAGREWGPTMRMSEISVQIERDTSIPLAEKDNWPDFRLLAPYLHARNNMIENNELYRTVEVLSDGNAIYLSGAGLGNVVRRNIVHDTIAEGAQSAIRTDDQQEGVTIAENIIYRCAGGGITMKHVNKVENNIVAGLIERKGREVPLPGYILLRRGPIRGSSLQRNILFHDGGKATFYDEARVKFWPLAYARDADTDRNLYYCTGDPAAAQDFLDAKHKEGIDRESVAADPMFADWKAGNFALQPGSPALKLGFVPIDQSKIGLLKGTIPGPDGLDKK